MTRLAQKNTHNKAKAPDSAVLYELITDAAMLGEEERELWLARYEQLSAHEQTRLYHELSNAQKESQKELEAHEARMAEINTKYEMKVRRLAEESKLEQLTGETPRQAASADPLEDDDLLELLRDSGEID